MTLNGPQTRPPRENELPWNGAQPWGRGGPPSGLPLALRVGACRYIMWHLPEASCVTKILVFVRINAYQCIISVFVCIKMHWFLAFLIIFGFFGCRRRPDFFYGTFWAKYVFAFFEEIFSIFELFLHFFWCEAPSFFMFFKILTKHCSEWCYGLYSSCYSFVSFSLQAKINVTTRSIDVQSFLTKMITH